MRLRRRSRSYALFPQRFSEISIDSFTLLVSFAIGSSNQNLNRPFKLKSEACHHQCRHHRQEGEDQDQGQWIETRRKPAYSLHIETDRKQELHQRLHRQVREIQPGGQQT